MAETVVINFVGNDELTPTIKEVNTQADKLGKNMENVSKSTEESQSKFSALGEVGIGALRGLGEAALGIAGNIGSAVVGGIGDFFGSAIQGSIDYQNVLAQTEAVIESTGGAAGYSVEQMQELASSMSAAEGMSLFPDDAILSAQNVLATFTKIEGVQFAGATQAALDMAQALGTDLNGAAMQMGKALNDPVKGLTALSRAGVSFTAEQQAMVEAMVESGDVAGAQNLILNEMAVQFGGSALKATETFEGSMILLSEGVEGAKGAIGDALLPVLTRFTNLAISFLLPALTDILAGFGEFINNLDWDAIIAAVSGLIQGFSGMVSNIDWASIFAAMSAFGDFLTSQLPAGMAIATPIIDILKNSFMNFFSVITGPAMQSVIGSITGFVTLVATLIGGLLVALAPAFARMGEVFAQAVPVIAMVGEAIMSTLNSPEVQSAFTNITTLVGVVGQILAEVASIVVSVFAYAFQFVWPIIDRVVKDIGGVINVVVPVIQTILQNLLKLLKGDFTTVWNNIKTAISNAWTGIKTAVQTGIDGIKTQLTGLINSAVTFGSDLASGIAKGISNGANAIANAAKDAAKNALEAAKDFLGIASPSKLFAKDIGQPIAQGIAQGILSGAGEIAGAVNATTAASATVTNSTVQNYYLTANYATTQSESTLRNDLRGLQLLSGAI
jgi:phage-related protein